MTKREVLELIRRLTSRCWYCGAKLPFRRRKDKHTCGPACRKALSRQWELHALKRRRRLFPKSEIAV